MAAWLTDHLGQMLGFRSAPLAVSSSPVHYDDDYAEAEEEMRRDLFGYEVCNLLTYVIDFSARTNTRLEHDADLDALQPVNASTTIAEPPVDNEVQCSQSRVVNQDCNDNTQRQSCGVNIKLPKTVDSCKDKVYQAVKDLKFRYVPTVALSN